VSQFENQEAANCPPESGGQRDREAHPAGGGSKTETFRDGNHPSHDLDFVSIMLPKFLDGGALPGLRSHPLATQGQFRIGISN
jgi:hypothetical protein